MDYSFKKFWSISIKQESNDKLRDILPIEWQLILMSDGSFTQHLNSLTGSIINLYIINNFTYTYCNMSYNVREVWLQDNQYKDLTFAKSVWPLYKNDIQYISIYQNKPIGQLLIESKLDIYKDINEIYYGCCRYLEKKLRIIEPTWGRKYTVYYKSKPLITINEIFSPKVIRCFKNIL